MLICRDRTCSFRVFTMLNWMNAGKLSKCTSNKSQIMSEKSHLTKKPLKSLPSSSKPRLQKSIPYPSRACRHRAPLETHKLKYKTAGWSMSSLFTRNRMQVILRSWMARSRSCWTRWRWSAMNAIPLWAVCKRKLPSYNQTSIERMVLLETSEIAFWS